MNILAFDTSFGACSAAVFRQHPDHPLGTQPVSLARRYETMAVGHAERLMPMIAEVMADSGLAFADLDAIAVTAGPGTFTGVRTAISAARGLALATQLPVIGITSLELIARRAAIELGAAHRRDRIAVCMEAGKGQIYAQLFGLDRAPLSEPLLTSVDDIQLLLGSGHWSVAGTAAVAVAEQSWAKDENDRAQSSADREGTARVRAMSEPSQPSADYLQGAGLKLLQPPRPLYLRAPDAIPQAVPV